MKKENIKVECVKSAFVDTKDFCIMSRNNDFTEVTEWHNGEGYLIHTCKQQVSGDFTDTYISFTKGEFEAIDKLIKKINKNE